jgi:hypothetical protein
VRKRLEVYQSQTRPLVDYYSAWAATGDARRRATPASAAPGTVDEITAAPGRAGLSCPARAGLHDGLPQRWPFRFHRQLTFTSTSITLGHRSTHGHRRQGLHRHRRRSGLGEGTARMLAANGGKVVIADLQVERGQAVAQEIGGASCKCDVSQEADGQAVVAAATGGWAS